jgi:hypothetical protein
MPNRILILRSGGEIMTITKRDAESHRIVLTFLGEKLVIAGWDNGNYPVICHPLYESTWTVEVGRYSKKGIMQYGSRETKLAGFFDIDKSLRRLIDIPPHVIGYCGYGIEVWFADKSHLALFQIKYPSITVRTP